MLTDKQQKALDIITEYIARYGKSPTIDELTELMAQKSKR
jgi:SOS-response transcriptional repressor LexA